MKPNYELCHKCPFYARPRTSRQANGTPHYTAYCGKAKRFLRDISLVLKQDYIPICCQIRCQQEKLYKIQIKRGTAEIELKND